MTERELREYIPFLTIEDGCVFSKRGDLTFGWKVFLPTAFTVNEEGYDSIITSFIQAYKLLPDWTVVHKQDVFKYDTYRAKRDDFFLADEYNKHFDGRKYLNYESYLYVTFSSKEVIERTDKQSGFFGILDKKVPGDARIQECVDAVSVFESVLKNNPLLYLERMSSDDFLCMDEKGRDQGIIADYLRLFDSDGPDYNLRIYKDRIDYGDRKVKIWYVEDSDAYPSVVSSVKEVGGMSSAYAKVFLSGGSPIGYSLRIPHVVNRYVLRLPRKVVEKELDTKKRLMYSFSHYSNESRINSRELQDYLDEVSEKNTVTVKCFMDLMAWPTQEELSDVRNAVVTAFQSDLEVSVVEEDRYTGAYHYAGIPSAAPELGYNSYLMSEVAAFLCHGLWEGYDFGFEGGLIHVCDRSSRIPITIDIQALAKKKGLISSTNAIVVGPTGSGKSFTMNSLVQDYYASGQHIVIIDVGDSYEGICAVINELSGGKDGVYNTYDPEHPFSFNPFHGRKHWNDVDDDGEQLSSGREFVISLITTMFKPKSGWDDTAKSVLNYLLDMFLDWWDHGVPENIVTDLQEAYANRRRERAGKNGKPFEEKTALYGFKNPVKSIFESDERGEDPVFDDFYEFVSSIIEPLIVDHNFFMGSTEVTKSMLDVSAFSVSMRMYSKSGIYGFLLNAKVESDLFESRLTVFEVDKIKDVKELFPLWILCIMHSFEDKMRGLQCQKVMVIEEAWTAISNPTMEKYIAWLWRTARKFSTSAIVVTQDIRDLTASAVVKDAIIFNSPVRILLDHRQAKEAFLNGAAALSLSPMATSLALSVGANIPSGEKYKEMFVSIGPNYCNVFALEVSEAQTVCFESEKPKKAPFLALIKKLGSATAAIRQIVAENNRNVS